MPERIEADLPDKRSRHHIPFHRDDAWEAALLNTLSPGDRVLGFEPGTSLYFGLGYQQPRIARGSQAG